jgi:Spy/CpxP family protein refolding chaperone
MDVRQGNRKAVLLVFLVFVLGIALGSVGTYVITTRVFAARPPGSHGPSNTIAIFTRHLNLSPEQQKQIETILSDTRARYVEIRQQANPEYEKVRQEGRERIRQVLTAEQKPKFEDMLQRMDAERQRRETKEHQ